MLAAGGSCEDSPTSPAAGSNGRAGSTWALGWSVDAGAGVPAPVACPRIPTPVSAPSKASTGLSCTCPVLCVVICSPGSGARVGELLWQLGFQTPVGKAHGALLSARRGGAQRAGLLPCLRGAPGMLPGLGSKLGPAEPPGGPSARDSAALPLPCVDWPPLPQKPPSRGGTSRPIQLPRRPGPSYLQERPVLAWTAFPQLASKNILRWVWAWGRRGLWLGCRPLCPLTAQPHSPVGRRPQSRGITLQTQLPLNLSGRTGVSSAPQEHIAWVLGRLQTPSVTTGVTCGCLAPSPTQQHRTREAFTVKTGHPEV